jgi:glycine oxidase
MNPSISTIIVGGGVIGLSLAWELAQRGRRVVVLDAGSVGKAASWAGAGILPPTAKRGTDDPYEQFRAMSHELHPLWAERLRTSTGIDTGYIRCGGIYLASSRAEAATLAANRWWWQEHGIAHQAWSLQELAQREPLLMAGRAQTSPSDTAGQADIRSVWYLPDECQLRNPHHLQALAAACRQQGVELVEQAEVTQLEPSHSGPPRVVTKRASYRAEQVCICSGAWARHMLAQLGLASGIMPVRGQMVLYGCDRPLLTSVVNEGHRYLVARRDGRLLAGSIEEEVGYAVETTDAGLSQIRNWAERILPQLKDQPIEKTWAGLRPGSFDGFPYMGAVPGHEQLYLAAGHYRSGIHLSCATAVLMANLMQGLGNPIDLHPFRIGRG